MTLFALLALILDVKKLSAIVRLSSLRSANGPTATDFRVPPLFLMILARIISTLRTSGRKFLDSARVIEGVGDAAKDFKVVFIDNDIAILSDEFWIVHELEKNLHLIFGRYSNLFKNVCGAIQLVKQLILIVFR